MMRIQRVLHATDFSPTSRTAFKYSARLAHVLKTPLDVIHVESSIGKPTFEVLDPGADESGLNEMRRRVLSGFRELAAVEIPETLVVRYLLGRGLSPVP